MRCNGVAARATRVSGPTLLDTLRAAILGQAGWVLAAESGPVHSLPDSVPSPRAGSRQRSGTDGGPPPAPDGAPPAAEGDSAIALALVERAQAGEAEAFGELYDRYADMVFRYIAYRVPNRSVAEDLTSETFLRALRRIGTFTWQGRDVGAWFVTIARNLIADHYKSGRYRLELTVEDVSLSAPVPVQDGPESEVLAHLANEVLLEAVKQLNPEQQECIALRFLQGMSVSETAVVMGKNEGAIKALQYRAVKSLGRLLPEGMQG